MLQKVRRYGRAVRAMARAEVRAAVLQARRARAARDWPAVAASCLRAAEAEPGWSTIWARLGHAQERQGDLAAAEASYRRALAIDGSLPNVQLRLAQLLTAQIRFSEAAPYFLAAAQARTEASRRRELRLFGYDDAEIDQALALGYLSSPERVAFIESAARARAAGDWRTVVASLRGYVAVKPDRTRIWIELSDAEMRVEELAAAEASAERAVTLESANAEAHLQLGQVRKLQRRFSDAAASFLEAARLDPKSPAHAELRAFGYSESNLAAAFTRGILPAAPPLQSIEAADRARAMGDWRAAAEHFAEALRADPSRAAIWVQLGHAHKEQGDPEQAESCYRRALEIKPTIADTYLQLGHALKLQQRKEEAAQSYFTAVRRGPTKLPGLYARAELMSFGYRSAAIDAAVAAGALAWPAPLPRSRAAPPPILSLIGLYFAPTRESGQVLPTLIRHPIRLPAGPVGIFIDVQMITSRMLPPIEVAVHTQDGEIPVHPVHSAHGPNVVTFRCEAATETDAEFVLRADLPPDSVIRRVEIGVAENNLVWPMPGREPGPADLPNDQIRNFIIGTTGICNASCPHCPTNKLVPSAQATSEMRLDLFNSLVDQIVENRIFITGHISLGLFGDGLLDRHVVDRAKRLRAAFPHAPLHVNTNAAAYNRKRHAELGSIASVLAIHVETLDEERYKVLMNPLRLPNVLPKIHQIIEDMRPIVNIASPMHRENIAELEEIRAYFAQRGVANTIFTPISNRCSRDEVFQKMALGPKSGTCPEEIIFDLIVDWDGTVLLCCNDFLRQEPIGNLAQDTLANILRGPKRQRAFDVLRNGTWQELTTCRNCKFDCGHLPAAA